MYILRTYSSWKLICLSLLIIVSLSINALGNPNFIKEGENNLDTLDKVSMMFGVSHGQQNVIDIKNHPTFRSLTETFLFSTYTELPDGLLFSPDGEIIWTPTSDQFLELKKQPIIIDFNAKNSSESYIVGQIRVIAQGELKIDPSKITIDSTHNNPAVVAKIREQLSAEPKLLPITIDLPNSTDWDTKNEGEEFSFEIKASGGSGNYKFELLEPEYLMGNLDRYGIFEWTPDYDVTTAEEILKSITLKLKVFDTEGNDAFTSVPIYINHVNRPPVVNELPTFYIQFNSANSYQLNKEGLAYDPDGDSIIFKPVLKELLQGMTLNTKGEIFWKPSKSQFNYLRAKSIYLSFTVQDFPAGAKSIGQIRIEVSQQDLPPQILIIPNKDRFEIKENEELQLSFFITDPNGQDDLLSFGFVSENSKIPDESLIAKDNWQYEFSWTPGYDFINKEGEKDEFDISFFSIDKESNRTEKNILVTVEDTEDLMEKDRVLYDQYRTVLERAWDMISQLNEKEKEFEKKYRLAKKGKKKRAITTASLGALTGLSPIIFIDNPDGQKVAAGLGGTATATIGTLEASNVIGEPPSDIMRDLNYVSQKKNDLLVYGNVFASKYALPLSKRDRSFQSDLSSLTIHLNLKDIANLDLDASWENSKEGTSKNIKKIFKDFNPDPRFEENYKN